MPKPQWTEATGRLPYASEVFGTYRPMVGWASKRKRDRIISAEADAIPGLLLEIAAPYTSGNVYEFEPDAHRWDMKQTGIGRLDISSGQLRLASAGEGTLLLPRVYRMMMEEYLQGENLPEPHFWKKVLGERMDELFGDWDGGVVLEWVDWSNAFVAAAVADAEDAASTLSPDEQSERVGAAKASASLLAAEVLDRESRLAAALRDLALTDAGPDLINAMFAKPVPAQLGDLEAKLAALRKRLEDPFLEMDPRNALNGASVSPLGIVHYFRQFFFELDSFLGTPVGHVWLAPGSTVEVVESSTRRSLMEKEVVSETETRTKAESSASTKDDISEAVKEENRQDTKLGFSTTVNQSWPAGKMSATQSINLDRTQAMARESTHQRLREQTDKLSQEMRSQFRTTFKTVTETTDVSSRRYVISNPSQTELQNYELRRKMRQVAVQVQDIGTYLCWETFVDDPGAALGLANLVHVGKPPETTPVQNPALIPVPERKAGITFDVKSVWHGSGNRRLPAAGAPGISLGGRQITVDIPDGYQLDMPIGHVFQLECVAANGEDSGEFRHFQYLAKYGGGREIDVMLAWGPGGLRWTHTVNLELRGTVALVPTPAVVSQIEAANAQRLTQAQAAARAEDVRKEQQVFIEQAQARITMAAGIAPRRFEDLREEERTVVYRALISDLMAKDDTGKLNYVHVSDERRHVFATVLDAIFDIDRMLYFAAPEWWKPRQRSALMLGGPTPYPFGPEKVVAWGPEQRPDDYYITHDSKPARLGSSLGWLLQLDGDDMRNRFLNAPWVRAVIPVRPGKEEAALEWLRRANVEGVDGLSATYVAEPGEDDEIADGLTARGRDVASPPTVEDAIRYLALRVQEKHAEGVRPRLFPESATVAEEDKVSATPVERVYEHGFYPLENSFRAHPLEDAGEGESPNFQIVSQWLEVLPTDQVVPVKVSYDPLTGRMLPPD